MKAALIQIICPSFAQNEELLVSEKKSEQYHGCGYDSQTNATIVACYIPIWVQWMTLGGAIQDWWLMRAALFIHTICPCLSKRYQEPLRGEIQSNTMPNGGHDIQRNASLGACYP